MLEAVKATSWIIGVVRQVDPCDGGGAARRVEGEVPHGQARLVDDRVLHTRRGVVPGMRREAALQRAAEVRAGDALQALVELDRQVAGLDQRVELAGRGGEVGIDLAVATAGARAGDRGAAEGLGGLGAEHEPAAIPLGAAPPQPQPVRHAGAEEPVEPQRVDRPDRVRADPEESPVQPLGDPPVHLQVEAGGLRLHRSEIPGQERVGCRRRGCLARRVHGHSPLSRRPSAPRRFRTAWGKEDRSTSGSPRTRGGATAIGPWPPCSSRRNPTPTPRG